MSRLIATDLDGTLLFPKRRLTLVSRKNKKFLRLAVKEGHRVVLATGRGQSFCHKVAKSLNIKCDFILYNGGAIELDGVIQDDSKHFIPQELLMSIDLEARKYAEKKIHLLVTSEDQLIGELWKLSFVERIVLFFLKISNGRLYEHIDYHDGIFKQKLTKNRGIYKYSLIFRYRQTVTQRNIYEAIKTKFGDYLEIQNLNHSIEITAKNTNKGMALEALLVKLGKKKEDVYVVGDDGNDIPLLARFENSFAMFNAKADVKSAAKYQVKRVNEMEKFIKEKENDE